MEKLRPKVQQMGPVDAIGLKLIMAGQRFIDMDNKATFTLETNAEGDIRLTFSRMAGTIELRPAQALWVIGPLNYAHLVDNITIFGQDVKRIYTIEPGEPVVYDQVTYDEKTDTCVFLLNDETQAALMGGQFFLVPSMLPDYGPKRYRIAEAVSDADGSRDEYLCPTETIGPGDHALARIKG